MCKILAQSVKLVRKLQSLRKKLKFSLKIQNFKSQKDKIEGKS